MSAMPEGLITSAEAGAILGIQAQTVWKAAKRGVLPYVKISRRRLGFPRDAVLLYAENRPCGTRKYLPPDIQRWGPRNRPIEHTDLMTTVEAAAVLGVALATVHRLVREGRLPGYQSEPCKRGCRIKIPTFYVYALAERPAYRERRAATARSSRDEQAHTSGWIDEGIAPVPRRGHTPACERDYGDFYTTRQTANALGVHPNAVLALHRRGRLAGGSRTPELDAYKAAVGCGPRTAGNRWLFFRKRDVHALMLDPAYQRRRASVALGEDRRPDREAARALRDAETAVRVNERTRREPLWPRDLWR